MIGGRVDRRYASALYVAASQTGNVDRVAEDLSLVRRTIQENQQLRNLLLERVTPDATKKRVLQKLFGPHLDLVTLRFLDLVVDKRRESVLETVEFAFRKIAEEKQGVQKALVTSAIPLTDSDKARTVAVLEKMTGKRVLLEEKIDPSIIGGLVVRVGDRVFDGSLKGSLEQLGRSLAGSVS